MLGSSSYCQGLMPRPHAKAWDQEEDQLILEMVRLTTEGPNWEQMFVNNSFLAERCVWPLANLGVISETDPPPPVV